MRATAPSAAALALAFTCGLGCTGVIAEPTDVIVPLPRGQQPSPTATAQPTPTPTPTPSPTPSPTTTPTPPPPPPECTRAQPIRVPTQRVTRFQYARMVRAALNLQFDVLATTPRTEVVAAPYSTYPEANPIGESEVAAYADTAEAIADAITDRLPACASGPEADCARNYLSGVANQLFRRPATAAELDPIVALFTSLRADFNYREALALALSALLQHPQTLYVIERSAGAGTITLDGDELVQRMALLYLGGAPDAALLAAEGELGDGAAREREARRMLGTTAGREAVAQYMLEWMRQEGFEATQYSAAIQAALREEVHRLLMDALGQPDGFAALLTSRKAYVNDALEAFYGLPSGPKGADGWRSLDLPEGARYGLLTHPLLMSRTAHDNEPSIILRGRFVREVLLCGQLGTPPAGAAQLQPVLPPGSTARQASEARMSIDVCRGCHTLMDPIGLGFQGFDGRGAIRNDPDTRGDVVSGGEMSGAFNGVGELARRLAGSEEAARCFSRQWLRYTFGKTEAAEDACAVKYLGDRFISSGRNLEALFAGVSALETFAERRGVAP